MPDFSLAHYAIAAAVMFIAKIYGTIVGGGSFLMQPVLIALGVPAHAAIAHDVSASLGNVTSSSYLFHKKRMVRYDLVLWLLPGMIVGPTIGAYLMTSLSESAAEKTIGILALASVAYVCFIKKEKGVKKHALPRHWQAWALLFGLAQGIYIGFSGGGVSLLHSFVMISLFGVTMIESAALRSVIYIVGHIAATISYACMGMLYWPLYAVLFVSSLAAGYVGGHATIKLGDKGLKIVFCAAATGLAVWLLVKS